jgi:hypothetical protein
MNAMGHSVRTFLGVNSKSLTKIVRGLVPDYMPMGSSGMADMGSMEMPMPENTLPMMTGFGQFGPMEMGGMFSVVKVRENLAADDYKDPGPYKNPPGTVAYEFVGDAGEAPKVLPKASQRKPTIQFYAVKPDSTRSSSHEH